jgi:Dehydrogenases with different specificities (related to short-chain alcohol dehydrogenases)
MQYLTVKDISKKWDISERRILSLCNSGRIEGAYKNGMVWNIPEGTKKPIDKRTKVGKTEDNTKTMVIAGIDSEIGKELTNILLNENYHVIGLYQKGKEIDSWFNQDKVTLKEIDYLDKDNLLNVCNEIDCYLDGFAFLEIYFNLEDPIDFDYDKFEESYKVNLFAPNLLTRELVKKMNYQSSIVIVSSIESQRGSFGASAYSSAQAAKVNLVQTFANVFTEMYGVRINSVLPGWISSLGYDDAFSKTRKSIPMKRLGEPFEIADDIFLMLTRHKYSTGSSLVSDGGYLSVDDQSRTEDIESGKFYRYLHKYFTEAERGTKMWIASTMMENEWNESPQERIYKQDNIDAAERGVEIERIFIMDEKGWREFKENPSILAHLENKKIKSLYVDRDYFVKNNPSVLEDIEDGFIGIDDELLLVDLPPSNNKDSRGYITFNKNQIKKSKKAYEELKKQAKLLSPLAKNKFK